jgi:hypothetical protein
MMDTTLTPTAPICPTATTRRAGRDLDAILARRRARLDERRESYPPDFIHGSARLGEVYDVLGAIWAEQALFVEPVFNEEGGLVALTLAWFEDYFLTVEQAVSGEVPNLQEWLEDKASERGRSVWLFLDGQPEFEVGPEAVVIECSLSRLLELERSVLSLYRDIDPGDRNAFALESEAVLRDSRTNILSLITLSARLIPQE